MLRNEDIHDEDYYLNQIINTLECINGLKYKTLRSNAASKNI